MHDKQFLFYVFAGISLFMMLSNIVLARVIKRSYARFGDLLAGGVETTGKILECRKLSGSRKLLLVKYEFQTAMGIKITGKSDLPEQRESYDKGTSVSVYYAQSNPSLHCLKDGLERRVAHARSVGRLIGFLPLQGAFVLFILWYLLITQHIVQLPA